MAMHTSNTPASIDGMAESSYGFTALHFASFHGNPKSIDLLVDHGADVYAKNKQDINMLHVAA
jgi:ankyrin repeat protein